MPRVHFPFCFSPSPPQTREVDTNIVSLSLGSLAEAASLATGDSVVCGNPGCGAMLNARSVLVDHAGRRVRGEPPCVCLCVCM